MFLIVTCEKNSYSKLHRLKKYYLDKYDKDDLQFGILMLKNRSALKNRRVQSIIDMFGGRVIYDNSLHAFSSNVDINEYSLCLTKNGTEDLLKSIASKVPSITATLIDISCKHIDFAQMMSEYCSLLKIVTNKTEKYSAFAQNMYEQSGNAIIVTNSLEKFNDSIIIVSPDNVILKNMEIISVPIVTTNVPNISVPFLITDFKAITPSKFVLNGILVNQHEYQSCLYKYCSVISLGDIKPSMAQINTKLCLLSDVKII